MGLLYRDGWEFVRQVRPLFKEQGTPHLRSFLACNWPGDRLVSLLECEYADAVKLALVCLSLIGTRNHCERIALKLHDDDATTVKFAEHALWTIWFHSGNRVYSRLLKQAVRFIDEGVYRPAILLLNRIVERCPDFAEAYHQRSAVCFLTGDYDQALLDGRRVLYHNPLHFGAMAYLGHSYAAAGAVVAAVEMYQAALQVHPHFEAAHQAMQYAQASISNSGSSLESPIPDA